MIIFLVDSEVFFLPVGPSFPIVAGIITSVIHHTNGAVEAARTLKALKEKITMYIDRAETRHS